MPPATPIAESPVTIIAPARGLVPLNLHELWEYRELAFFFLARDLKGRFRQMALGPLWMLVNPLLNMVLFTVIFSMVAGLPSDGIPYPLFNYSALLPWTFFSACLFTTSNSLLGYKDLIAKIYFPRLIVPIVGVLSALVDLAISFIILLGMMWFYGFPPTWAMTMIPVYLLLAAMCGLAVGLWAASLIVHYYDISIILGYLVRIWMYATPVVYATSLVPEQYLFWYRLNPMTSMIDGFRWAMLGKGSPPDLMLALGFLLVLPFLIGGAYFFRRTERSIVDIA